MSAETSSSWGVWPTPFPEVNGILKRLLRDAQEILGDRFVGMYLHGSLAMGGFNVKTSDIDFLVVTDGSLPEETLEAITEMHHQIADDDPKWAPELEGSYIPKEDLRRYDPGRAIHPHIARGGALSLEQHDSDWVIQRHILRERGAVVAGPDPKTLIDEIGPEELRQAVVDLLWWWELQIADTALIKQSPYQAYAVLTMCRMLYTMVHGEIVTKQVAAQWAMEVLEERWSTLIEQALAWRPPEPMDRMQDTVEFIRFALETCRRS